MISKTLPYGYIFEDEKHLIFWGNKKISLDQIKDLFPYLFIELRQTHSDILVNQDDPVGPSTPPSGNFNTVNLQPGDAHFTLQRNLGLLIKTADCMPLFIYSPESKKVLAIHAGWRGIANQITIKALRSCFFDVKNLFIFIGPYIHQSSFEVDTEVKDTLLSTISNKETRSCFFFNDKTKKFHMDLKSILLHHLKENFPEKKFQFWDLEVDTYRNQDLHSYRRDKNASGRNYSFIVKK